jgi:hypothetical protein
VICLLISAMLPSSARFTLRMAMAVFRRRRMRGRPYRLGVNALEILRIVLRTWRNVYLSTTHCVTA